MYASFRSVRAKNGKILTPTRTGNFSLASMDWEFYAMWKSFDLLYKIWFILGVVALLEACDVPTMVAVFAAILDFTKN